MRGLGSPHVIYSELLIGSDRPHDFETRDPGPLILIYLTSLQLAYTDHMGIHSCEGTGPLTKILKSLTFDCNREPTVALKPTIKSKTGISVAPK